MRCCSKPCVGSRAEPRAAKLAAVALGFAALAAGCASVPQAPLPPDEPFAIDGRFSARRGDDGVTMNFSWTHAAPRDAIVLTSPLGQAFAELEGDASVPRTELRGADGRYAEASDWPTLTARTLGLPLPVANLVWWTRGAPRADVPHTMENDAFGRAGVLRQDGCEIAYGYVDDTARRPSRLNLRCRDIEMRIVIDRWRVS